MALPILQPTRVDDDPGAADTLASRARELICANLVGLDCYYGDLPPAGDGVHILATLDDGSIFSVSLLRDNGVSIGASVGMERA